MRLHREGRGRNRLPPTRKIKSKKKKQQRGEGGGARKQPTATKPPANTTRVGQTPPPEGTEDRIPKEAQGDHHAKTGNTKPGTAAHREEGHRNMQTHTTKKKKPAVRPKRKGMGEQGPQGLGQGHPERKKKAQKTHHDNPTKKGWAEPRPGPTTHAHSARRNQKRRGASGARTKPHTSHKQAETDPQPRTPQTADTRETTPQTVPEHTHPRPQPGLAGLTKRTPNRKPDQNTNAAQQ